MLIGLYVKTRDLVDRKSVPLLPLFYCGNIEAKDMPQLRHTTALKRLRA